MNAKEILIMKILTIVILFSILTVTRIEVHSRPIKYITLYEPNRSATEIINYNVYEYISDCLGRDILEKAVNESGSCFHARIFYDPDGEINSIQTRKMQNLYFTPTEWEVIFDYLHDLPPLPLPNCFTYLNLGPGEIYTKDTIVDIAHQSLIDYTCMFFPIVWSPDIKECNTTLAVDSIKQFDVIEGNQYQYKPFYRTEHPDSLFGLMRWEEVKRRYHDALESGGYEQTPLVRDQIYDGDFDAKGYTWEKIPIKNLSVNIQVPVDSETTLSPDTLSASVTFPDSTYIDIRYTKDMPWTELYDGEKSPRKRQIYKNIVTEKYILSSGEFVRNGKTTYWERIRYRYGLTVTLYTSKESNLEKYYSPVIATITTVLRPKFKTIYLKDDGY